MANVKYGSEIKTKADLQNLITGLIFRSSSYNLSEMVNLVARYSKGAEIVLSERELTSMVEDTLDLFQRENIVSCENGQYTTRKITHIQLSGRRHPATEKTSINDTPKIKSFKIKRGRLSSLFDEIDAHEDMFAKHKDENKVNAYNNEEDILSK